MRFTALILATASLAAANPLLGRAAGCNADDCARAVTGTNRVTPPLTSRIADCSSFFKVTVTPTTVSETTTTTKYSVVTVAIPTATKFIGDNPPDQNVRRAAAAPQPVTQSPTAVPSYASACGGSTRYSSACVCAGVTKSTSTAPTPTTTVTKTTVVTTSTTKYVVATVVPGPRPACGSTVLGHGSCGCEYTVDCDKQINGGILVVSRDDVSEAGCLSICDDYSECFKADYSRVTGLCRVFTGTYGTAANVTDDDIFTWSQTKCPQPNNGCLH